MVNNDTLKFNNVFKLAFVVGLGLTSAVGVTSIVYKIGGNTCRQIFTDKKCKNSSLTQSPPPPSSDTNLIESTMLAEELKKKVQEN